MRFEAIVNGFNNLVWLTVLYLATYFTVDFIKNYPKSLKFKATQTQASAYLARNSV